ncbi:MAG: hypothetical protein ABEH81_00805 [Halopenitus sp.]
MSESKYREGVPPLPEEEQEKPSLDAVEWEDGQIALSGEKASEWIATEDPQSTQDWE